MLEILNILASGGAGGGRGGLVDKFLLMGSVGYSSLLSIHVVKLARTAVRCGLHQARVQFSRYVDDEFRVIEHESETLAAERQASNGL